MALELDPRPADVVVVLDVVDDRENENDEGLFDELPLDVSIKLFPILLVIGCRLRPMLAKLNPS